MPLPNSENPGKGRDFEEKTKRALSKLYNTDFYEQIIEIGNPPKAHKFDLVSANKDIIVECKNFSWTETGNIPQAKMGFLNQAVLYLSHTPEGATKIIVLRKDNHSKRKESLAEYYVRTYNHLLRAINVMELDEDSMVLKKLNTATKKL